MIILPGVPALFMYARNKNVSLFMIKLVSSTDLLSRHYALGKNSWFSVLGLITAQHSRLYHVQLHKMKHYHTFRFFQIYVDWDYQHSSNEASRRTVTPSSLKSND